MMPMSKVLHAQQKSASHGELPIYLNGRFLSQRRTGVQRFAFEILTTLDEEWPTYGTGQAPPVVLVPANSPTVPLKNLTTRPTGRLTGHAWEQFELPRASADGFLINFGATGPLFKRRQLITVHDAAVHAVPEAYSRMFRWWYKTLIPILGRSSLGVMTVSQFSRGELVRHFRIPPGKVRLCTEGKEHMERTVGQPGVLEEYGLQPGRYFLAVSSMSPHKNFGIITKALRHLVDSPLMRSGITVAIAGAKDSSVFHQMSSEETQLVSLLGYVSDAELKTLLENAIALIHPSRYEGFGLAPLEAMTVGCPVIASRAAAIPEVCGDAAWYFDPQDERQLADLMSQLATDPAAREALRQAGLVRASKFCWGDAARSYVEALEQLGGMPGRGDTGHGDAGTPGAISHAETARL